MAPQRAISEWSGAIARVDGETIGLRILIAGVYNTFNVQRHLTSATPHRVFGATAMNTWREAAA
jgi:hypothetical protein